MRIALTGASGLVGRFLLCAFRAEGHQVEHARLAAFHHLAQAAGRQHFLDLLAEHAGRIANADLLGVLVVDPDDTRLAIDRDGALAALDAMDKLQQEGKNLPAYLMISYVGSQEATTDPANEKWYAYVESKKEVDNRLVQASYPHLILKPAMLTEEPAKGIEQIEDKMLKESLTSSRELVADVIVEALGRENLPESPLAFVDGDNPVSSIK